MKNELIYALAGLLHDIGKFGQRADISFQQSGELNEQSKRLANQICNISQQGYYTHQHVIWTNNFLETHKTIFEKAGVLGNNENNLFNLAVYHHKPSNFEQAIITIADHWSSGIDRNSDRILEKNPNLPKDKFRAIPLTSIFNELSTATNPGGIKNDYAYSLQTLSIDNTIFPQNANGINIKDKYPTLWQEFNEEVQLINATNAETLITSLYFLLKKYTWYIPGSTMDYPNCSLFEHLKTTGAFAHSLYTYFTANPQSYQYEKGRKITIAPEQYPLIMLCGDISGIQQFIYNISNKSAMKSLKGRSFYVQLLSETLSDELLDCCGASIINQVYAAGGKFYLLLPNTKEVIKAISDYQQKIEETLWNEFAGKISVNIGYVPFTMIEAKGGMQIRTSEKEKLISLGELWKLVAEKTAQLKKKRFKRIIENQFSQLFMPSGAGGTVQVCAVTGEELISNKAVNLDKKYREQGDNSNDEVLVSPTVNKQIEIGAELYDARFMVKYGVNQTQKGYKVGVNTYWDFVKPKSNMHTVAQWVNIQFNNAPSLFPEQRIETNAAVGFKFYGGIPMVSKEKKVATLEEICLLNNLADADEAKTEKLGILRMDVDNLGQLFMHGFGSDKASFSKLATLSALLEQFFSGHLNYIKAQEKYKNNINIVYAGGDDVFAVGRWDLLIDFAIEVQAKFQAFAVNRNDITLSGGIVIVNPKFPIAKAAELAAEAEKKAKNYVFEKEEKNALCLFDFPLNWNNEMPFVIECKNDWIQWIANKKLVSKGFLMKMFDYYQVYTAKKPDWQWQAAYTIARYAKEAKNEEQKAIYNRIKELLFTKNYKNKYTGVRFEAFIVACRWAELILKQTKI